MSPAQESGKGRAKLLGIEMPDGLRKYNYYALFWCSMVLMIQLTYITVINPIFIKEVLRVGPANFGKINTTLVFLNEIAAIAFFGLAGILSDKFGRKILMTLGLFIGGITFIVFGHSTSIADALGLNTFITVYFLRFLVAFCVAFGLPQMFTIIGDYTYQSSRGKGMAAISLASGFGAFLSFSIMGAIPVRFGIFTAFYICGVLCMMSGIISHFWVADKMHHKSEEVKPAMTLLRESFEAVRYEPALKMCYGAAFTSRGTVAVGSAFMIMWAVQVAEKFDMSSSKATMYAGIIVGISSIVGLITTPLWGIFTDRWGRLKTLILGFVLGTVGFGAMTFAPDPFSTYTIIAMVILGVGQIGTLTASTTLAADLAPKKILGSVLGGFNTFGAIGIFVLGIIGGVVFDSLGYTMPFLVTALANFLIMIWAIIVLKAKNKEAQ